MRFFALLFAFFLCLPLQAALTFPELGGRVVDEAGLLSKTEQKQLASRLEALENATTDQLVVVTLNSLDGYDIADYGYRLGRHWGIGQKGKDNGILLIVAPNERKVRIEVGYGLEGTVTDYRSKLIIDERILPRFKKGDFPGGIDAGTKAIIDLLKNPSSLPEKPAEQHGFNFAAMGGFEWFILIFIVFPIVSALLSTQGNALRSVLVALAAGVIAYLLFRFIFSSVIVFIIAFFSAYFGNRSGDGGFGGGYGSGSGFSSGGGFGGGGGSFGGGGASGSW